MRADDEIEGNAVDRLEKFLQQGTISKTDEIDTVLLKPSPDGKT